VDNNYFSTTDLRLATFLDMSGIDLREVLKTSADSKQYKFEFRIKKGSKKLKELIDEWNSSDRAKDLKRFSYSNKKLKAILAEKLYNNN
jgi:hypothetical protein